MGDAHKVLLYLEYHSVCPIVRIGTPPPKIPHLSVSFPRNQEGDAHSPAGEGAGGGPNSDDWRKGIVLCLLCGDAYMSGTSVATWVRGSYTVVKRI